MNKIYLAFTLIFLSLVVSAQENNSELEAIFNADQAARQTEIKDWEEIYKQDSLRRAKVLALLKNNEIKTARDHYHAAFIFQHGDSKEDIRLAHAFATLSSLLSEDPAKANWIKAASWDRLMLRYERPQWFGTQYVKNDEGDWALYEIEPNAISDEDRKAWSVPILSEAMERVKKLNERN